MKSLSTLLSAGLLVTGLTVMGQALEQQTKDSINNAAKPVQKGVGKATDALQRLLYGQRGTFQSEVQAALDQSQSLKSKLTAGAPAGSDVNVQDLQKELDDRSAELREKQAALKNATEQDYSDKYEETHGSLNKLQEANFKAAALYQDARAEEEKKATQSLSALKKDIESLQSKNATTQEARDEVRDTVKELTKEQQQASEKVQQLKAAKPEQWASIRSDIDKIIDEAKKDYHETMSKIRAS